MLRTHRRFVVYPGERLSGTVSGTTHAWTGEDVVTGRATTTDQPGSTLRLTWPSTSTLRTTAGT